MHPLCLTFLAIIPSTVPYLDCRKACKTCRDRTEHPSILEVYCAMCRECKEKRRERMQSKTFRNNDNNNCNPPQEQEYPEGCPTPLPCNSDYEDREKIHHMIETTTTTVETTTTMATTTKPPCPPIQPCRKRRTTLRYVPRQPCCLPICNFQCPMTMSAAPFQQLTTLQQQRLITTVETTTDAFYVYIGVPKGVLDKNERSGR